MNLKSSRRTILNDLIKDKILKIYGKTSYRERNCVYTHTYIKSKDRIFGCARTQNIFFSCTLSLEATRELLFLN